MTEISQTAQIAETRSMQPFSIIWTGQAISIFGSALVQFALIWYLTVQSRSAMVLTLATLVQMLPRTILGAFRSLMAPLGLVLAGPFTDVFGMHSWMLGAGIGTTIVVGSMPFISQVADIQENKCL